MANIFDSIGSVLDRDTVQNIKQQTGEDQNKINSTIGMAIPLLVDALAKNSSAPQGSNELHNAVQKDHDGSILDNIMNIISQPERSEGPGILSHVFGNNMDSVGNTLSKQSGMSFQNVMKILMILAPIVMGILGKKQREKNLDPNQMSDYLNNSVNDAIPKERSVFDSILDGNRDGNTMDDLARIGAGLFSKFFTR